MVNFSANPHGNILQRHHHRLTEYLRHLINFFRINNQRWQKTNGAAVAAAEFDDEAVLQALTLDFGGEFAVGGGITGLGGVGLDDFDADHQAAAADVAQVRGIALNVAQVAEQALAHLVSVGAELLLVDRIQGDTAGDHGQLVAAEGAGVGARGPLV